MLPDMVRMCMLVCKKNIIVQAIKSDGYKHVSSRFVLFTLTFLKTVTIPIVDINVINNYFRVDKSRSYILTSTNI